MQIGKEMEILMPEHNTITRALTLGVNISEVGFCTARGLDIKPIEDENIRKDLLSELVSVGFGLSNLKTKAAACKFASVVIDQSGISKRLLGDRDEKEIKRLKNTLVHSLQNYSPHDLAKDGYSSSRSTAWKEAQDSLSGKHLTSVLKGESQLPIYHRKLNFPLHNQQYTIVNKNESYYLCAAILNTASAKKFQSTTWLAFKLRIKDRDFTRVSEELNRVITGEYKSGTSRLIREMHRGKPKWTTRIIVTHVPQASKPLALQNIMGIDLGYVIPAVVNLIKNGKQADWTKTFGNGQSINTQRQSIQNQIRRLNRELRSKDVHLGNERRSALLSQKHALRKKEKDFIKTASQKVAKGIADFAMRNSAGIWVLENLNVAELKDAGVTESDKHWLKRNWSPALLIEAIKWNARKIGAQIIEVDPRDTSRICFKCGNNDRINRESQAEFCCKSCGHKDNADRNAARNIAKRGKELLEANSNKV